MKLIRILLSIAFLAILVPLWLIGYQRIREFGLIGSFRPIADCFGLPVIPVFITFITILVICIAVSIPFIYHIVRAIRGEKEGS